MALKDTITALLRRVLGMTDTTPKVLTTTEGTAPRGVQEVMKRLSLETGRAAEVKDCRKMYQEDTRAKGIIQALARDTVQGGFTVRVTDGPDVAKAQELADELVKRLKLFSRLDDWGRLTFRDGDSFLEMGVGDDLLIHTVTRKPTLEMRRASNSQDTFDDPTRAYWWSDKPYVMEPPGDVIWFAAWQIIHARWDHDEGERYGHGLLSAGRKSYKRMTEGELDLAIRRKTRAGLKYFHRFPEGTGAAEIEAYREINKDALNDPWAAVADFFGTVEIKTAQGDARLSEIDDVVHHIRTFWVTSPVPMSLLGYGQDLNRDVLEEQSEQYDRALVSTSQWMEDQILVPLIHLQWMLQGLWPASYRYELAWSSRKAITAEQIGDIAEAVLKLQTTQLIPADQLLTILAMVLPGLDWGAIREELEKQADETDRIAQAAAMRLGRRPAPEDETDDDLEDEEEEEARSNGQGGVFRDLATVLKGLDSLGG